MSSFFKNVEKRFDLLGSSTGTEQNPVPGGTSFSVHTSIMLGWGQKSLICTRCIRFFANNQYEVIFTTIINDILIRETMT